MTRKIDAVAREGNLKILLAPTQGAQMKKALPLKFDVLQAHFHFIGQGKEISIALNWERENSNTAPAQWAIQCCLEDFQDHA